MATSFNEVLNRQLELSNAAPQNFYMTIEKLPQVVYTVQSLDIPTISAGETDLPNPINPGGLSVPGDTLNYGQLNATFLLDKNFRGYRTILDWIKGITSPDAYGQNTDYFAEQNNDSRKGSQKGMSDISVFAVDAANEPIVEWKFKNCFPLSLDGPQFNATAQDVEYMTSTVSFEFMLFENTTYTNGQKNNDTI
jgi:hypothetical protein